MKKAVYVVVYILFMIHVNCLAQFFPENKIYTHLEINTGNYFGGSLNLNYVSKNNISVAVGVSALLTKPDNLPWNYRSGAPLILFPLFESTPYFEALLNTHFLVGKVVQLNKSGSLRANILAGLGIATIGKYNNWRPIDKEDVSENYEADSYSYTSFSLKLNPKIEFAFTRCLGIHLSPMLIINNNKTYAGLGSGIMIGFIKD